MTNQSSFWWIVELHGARRSEHQIVEGLRVPAGIPPLLEMAPSPDRVDADEPIGAENRHSRISEFAKSGHTES
jgi:hypothetical protein